MNGPHVQPPKRGQGLIVCFALSALAAVALWPVIMAMGAFSCDSGWEGCADAAATMVLAYPFLVGVFLVGLLVLGAKRPTRGVRITAGVLMPLSVLLAAALSFSYVILRANLAT